MFLKKFVVGGLLSIALIAAFSFVPLGSKVGAEVYFSDKFVANLSEDEIRVIVEEKVAEFENQTVRIGKQAVTPVELGVTYNIDKTVSRLLKQKATLLASLTKADSTGLDIVEGEIVLPVIEYNYGELRMKIASILEEYETEPVDAAVVFGDNGYYVTESSLGRTIIGKDDLIEDIVDKLGKDLLKLDEEKNYAVKYMAVSPRYNTEQAKVVYEKLSQVLSSPVKISIAGELREIEGLNSQKWFDFDYEKGEIFLVNSEVESFVADFAKEFNEEASIITVKAINSYASEYYGKNTYYKAEVDGVMKSGKWINQEKLVADIITAFGSDEKVVYVEFDVAPMTVKSEVEGASFDDMISVGKSSYALGNQPNRVHNIKTATAYQNAVVIF